jgi:transcriptional regulator with XRE-family HTH domain
LRCLPAIIRFIGYNPLPEPTSIVEELVHFRTARGMCQHALAGLIGIDPTALARWERGERQPAGTLLEKVNRFLRVASNLG